ncbi:MAG: TadE/TadG family type IV pilus assembly protein, partial [Bdellovibrionales bacterium]
MSVHRLSINQDRAIRRKGAVSIITLLILMTLIVFVAASLGLTWVWTVRVELQRSIDAGGLAAGEILVDDDLLRGTLCQDSSKIPALLLKARMEANLYTGNNPVGGKLFQLDPNILNDPNGDIVFGTLDNPRGQLGLAAMDVQNPSNISLANINTVRINGVMARNRGTGANVFFGPL